MGELTLRVGGTSLRTFGPYSGVKMTTTARGSGIVSWSMTPGRHRPMQWALDQPVQAIASGAVLWSGLLAEPGTDGTFHAYGLPVLADSTPALVTTEFGPEPSVADAESLSEAVDRGALPGWRKGDPFAGVSWGGDPEPGLTISGLFDKLAFDHGLRWRVTPHGDVVTYPVAPGTPDFQVQIPGYLYGYDVTDLATVLYGRYMKSEGGFGYTSVTTNVDATRREQWVDLEDRGLLTEAGAQAALREISASQGSATPAPTEPIAVGWGQLRTLGGTLQEPWRIRGGHTLRVWGATDGRSGKAYRDFRVDTTDYDNDADVAVIQLAHASPRGFTAALEAMFAAS